MPPPPPSSVAAASRAALLGAPDDRASEPFPPPSTFPGAPPPVTAVTLLYFVKAGATWSASTSDGTPVLTVKTSAGWHDKLDVVAPDGKHPPVWASATHRLSGVGSSLSAGRGGAVVAVLTDGADAAEAAGRWVVRYPAAAASGVGVGAAAGWTPPAALAVEPPAAAAARRAPSAVVTAAADGRAVVAVGLAADGKRALVRLAPGADVVIAAWLTACAARWRKEGRSKGGGAEAAEAGVELGLEMVG